MTAHELKRLAAEVREYWREHMQGKPPGTPDVISTPGMRLLMAVEAMPEVDAKWLGDKLLEEQAEHTATMTKLDETRARLDEYKREVERRDELLSGVDADLREARAALARAEADAAVLRAYASRDLKCGRISNDHMRCELKPAHAGHHHTWSPGGPACYWPETEAIGWAEPPEAFKPGAGTELLAAVKLAREALDATTYPSYIEGVDACFNEETRRRVIAARDALSPWVAR